MSCSTQPAVIHQYCDHKTPVKTALVSKEQMIEIEKAYNSGDKEALKNVLAIVFSNEYVSSSVAFNAKDERIFTETEATAKNIMDYYEYDPPEYNQTKYLHNKPNARPIVNGFKRMARNNIKQKQRW